MKKFVLFTHIDLDGAGCAILLKKYLGDNLVIHYVNYGFEEADYYKDDLYSNKYDVIFITDISVSKDSAIKLNSLNKSKVIMLDHHQSAHDSLSDLNYKWIKIDTTKSGTMLTYEFLKSLNSDISEYDHLVKYINDYDLWNHNFSKSLDLQILFTSIGRDLFVDRFTNNPLCEFDKDEIHQINLIKNSMTTIYNKIISTSTVYTDIDDMKFLYINLSDNIVMMSYIMYKVLSHYKDKIDYAVCYTKYGSLSFRSLKYTVRLIAESLGGGGHDLASGASVPNDGIYDIVKSISHHKWIKKLISIGGSSSE